MIVRFDEEFALPVEEVFGYCKSPVDWTRLFGFPGGPLELGDGWFSVPLKSFPFPLVAKNVAEDPPKMVRWVFRGFWKGEGEVRFTATEKGVLVQGFEEISVRPLGFLSPIVEKLLLEKSFCAIWEVGWRRLRKKASAGSESGS